MKLVHAVADLPDGQDSPHAALKEQGNALFNKLANELYIVTQKKSVAAFTEITGSFETDKDEQAVINKTAEALEDIRIFAKGEKPTGPGKMSGPRAGKTMPFMSFEFRSFISYLGDLAEACIQSASLLKQYSESGDGNICCDAQIRFLMFAEAAADHGRCPPDISDAVKVIVNLVYSWS